MFRLTRQVRCSIATGPTTTVAAPSSAGAINGHGGSPPLVGFAHFVTLSATLEGAPEHRSGYLRNIREIDDAVRRLAVPALAGAIADRADPAATMLAMFAQLRDAWTGARLAELEMALSPYQSYACRATEVPMVRLSQKFEFSAAHRLHNPELSDEENRRCFGKCNNVHGHGHNYELQVTVLGKPGETISVPELERVVEERAIAKVDHKHLNVEVAEFAATNPSVEHIAQVIYRWLKPHVNGLASVTVWETPKTWCEYGE